jgi:hypothetical protein
MKKILLTIAIILIPTLLAELYLSYNTKLFRTILLDNSHLILWSQAAPVLNHWPETIIMGSSIAKQGIDPVYVEKGLKRKNSIGSITVNADSTSMDYLTLKRILETCITCPKRIIYQLTETSLRKHETKYWEQFTLTNIQELYYPDSEIDQHLATAAKMDHTFSEYYKQMNLEKRFHLYATRGELPMFLFGSVLTRAYPKYTANYHPLFDDRDSTVYGIDNSRGIGYSPSDRVLTPQIQTSSIAMYHSYLENYEVGGVTEYFFQEFVSLAKKKNIKLYFVLTPESTVFLSTFHKERAIFTAEVTKIAHTYDVPLIDNSHYLSDKTIFFGDTNHLNRQGAKLYSKKLGEELSEIW